MTVPYLVRTRNHHGGSAGGVAHRWQRAAFTAKLAVRVENCAFHVLKSALVVTLFRGDTRASNRNTVMTRHRNIEIADTPCESKPLESVDEWVGLDGGT